MHLKILHNLFFLFTLGITALPRKIENNAYTKFSRGQIRCIMGDVKVVYIFPTTFLKIAVWGVGGDEGGSDVDKTRKCCLERD